MALTIGYKSTQITTLELDGENQLETKEAGGRIRTYHGYYKNETGGTLAADSIFSFLKLPAGSRVLPTSKVYFTAMGAARTLDLGWQNYTENDGDAVTEDVDGMLAAEDVSAAGSADLSAITLIGHDFDGQVEIVGKIAGGTMPSNGEFSLFLDVVVD